MPEKFEALLPEHGFLRDYVEWTRQTEPPTSFHFFTAMAIIASALQRNVWIDQGAYKVYPAGWFILVAPTGICKKSSCTRIGMKLLREALPQQTIIEEKATPEGLIEALSRSEVKRTGGRTRTVEQVDAICTIHAPELGVFLGRQAYNEGLVVLLTSLIDSPDHFDSVLVKRDRSLKNVAITGLGASNPDWLSSAVSIDAHGGGFLSRVLFICEETTDRCFPRPPPLCKETRPKLIEQIAKFGELHGEFRLDKEADEWFDDWYRREGRNMSAIEGLEARRPDHVLRVSMLMAASEHMPYVISVPHLELSLKLLKHILRRAEVEVTEFTVMDEAFYYVRKMLRKHKEITHSDLIRRCSSKGILAEDVKRYINSMIEAEEVELDSWKRNPGKVGKAAKLYKWKGGMI